MHGFHEIFIFGAVTAVVAAVCSGLRGSDHRAGTSTSGSARERPVVAPTAAPAAVSPIRR